MGEGSIVPASSEEPPLIILIARFHSENGILTTIFTLCMWSVIFAPIDGVFETPYQSSPLDLQTDSFSIGARPHHLNFDV